MKVAVIVVLILVSMFFSIYFRSYPASLPIADEWAQSSLMSSLQSQVAAGIDQQYPHLPAAQKQTLIDQQMASIMKNQGSSFSDQIASQAAYIRSQLQDDDNQTYLLAIDPYYYYRHTKNVLDHGYGADTIIDGVKVNDHMVAPVGREEPETDFHSRLSAFIYRLVHFFNHDAKLFNVFFWMPVIISSLAVIPAFFIARKRAGLLGGFIASMLVAVHSTFIGRTAAGFADTDGYNVLFPLLIFWMFIEAFEAKDRTKTLILAALTGLFTGIYSKFWQGWWYIFDFMLVAIIVYIAYSMLREWLKHKDFKKALFAPETKRAGISIAGVLIGSGIFVSLFQSFKTFINAPLSALSFTSIQNAAHANLWPNVFTTVAELNRASLSSIVAQIGGSAYFYLACLGVIITLVSVKKFSGRDWAILAGGALVYLLLITKPFLTGNPYLYLALLLVPVAGGLFALLKDNDNIDTKYAIFLVVWFVGTIYASTQGVRFILLLVPAFAVALGIFVGQIYKIITNWAATQWEIDQIWVKAIVVIIALTLLINPLVSANKTARTEIPSMNDAWWNTLTKINTESAPDAIINSWWDFGHWFKAIGDRAVTFDGTSQNTPMAHWIGKALSTDNETEAVGILRMLDCGSRRGFDTLELALAGQSTPASLVDSAAWDKELNKLDPESSLQAKDLMDTIILQNKTVARQTLLAAGLSSSDTDKVLGLTHCDAPEDYFITSGDMVGKASVWGHFGLWDFKRAYAYTTFKDATPDQAVPVLQDLFSLDAKQAGQMYYDMISLQNEQQANQWISPWPNYWSSSALSCTAASTMLHQETTQNGSNVSMSNSSVSTTISCDANVGLGTQQGQSLRLTKVTVDPAHPESVAITITAYDASSGQLLGTNQITPDQVSIGENGSITTTVLGSSSNNLGVFVADVGGQYKAVLASTELATSMFTRLFYFDGAFTDHFTKFNDQRSVINGDRIITWKVDW